MKIPPLATLLALMALATCCAEGAESFLKSTTNRPASAIAGPLPQVAPQLTQCLKIVQDPIGITLQSTFVWADLPADQQGVALGFRKTFDLAAKPDFAGFHLFADARYILWVNGTYVDRGPARFQPNGPEYDTIDITRFLKPGKNVVALLVAGNISGGKVMRHRPGLTASLEVDGKALWGTDAGWRWSDRTRFRLIKASWPNLWEADVDARVEDGDWTMAEYKDEGWQSVLPISGAEWGPLTARRIPMLREQEIPFTLSEGKALPVTLKDGEKLEVTTSRIVQAYPVIAFTADVGTELIIEPYGVHYIAKDGPQTHFTIDTRGITNVSVAVTKGMATITGLKLLERLYPYERLASFQSDDPFLNRLWVMCARSCEVLSEDSYVDCADRERVEWMDDTPPGYDITRTAMAGPAGPDGKKIYGDPRLLGELIRRTALTLQPEGWVKAHTCSDRYDIHAKMEDRACDWVEGIRLYHEATGDAGLVREIWPAVKAQMDYFLVRRTAKGLVSARDWVVWKNPTGYLIGQATPLNCFICRALADASRLAKIAGDDRASERYATASTELKGAINRELWDERSGSYFGGYFDAREISENKTSKIAFKSKDPLESRLKDGYFAPTLEANVFALDRGIVPEERRKRVIDAVLADVKERRNVGGGIMTAYYLFKQLYALDQPEQDLLVLDLMRKRFPGMVDSPMQCSWEGYGGGSKAHIYGMYPGYFLSAYVLGVRRDAPVAERQLLIEPHLGNLNQAQGTVVTEFGTVTVSWSRDAGKLHTEIILPDGPSTTLALPLTDGLQSLLIDGKEVSGEIKGNRLCVPISSGKHAITY
ncbi:MAG: alpha-L-rhamnosidase C-terminal domain-containing protein [bacterium]